jgi:hypothetical protein
MSPPGFFGSRIHGEFRYWQDNTTQCMDALNLKVPFQRVKVCNTIGRFSGGGLGYDSSNPYIIIISELRKRKALRIFNRPLFFNLGKLLNYLSP